MPSPQQVVTQIANLALAHCGVSKPIANFDTERSVEAQMCRTLFDLARQKTLADFPWYFAVKQVIPALVANYPTPEWMYAYQYPSDAVKINRFISWRLNNDTRQSRIPYTIMQPVSIGLSTQTPPPKVPYAESSGQWIYTNWPGTNISLPTIIEYIFDNQNIPQWTPEFIEALSLKLATYIIPTLTTGDPNEVKAKVTQLYMQAISQAAVMAGNNEQRPEEPESEFIRARFGEWIYGTPGGSWQATDGTFYVQ